MQTRYLELLAKALGVVNIKVHLVQNDPVLLPQMDNRLRALLFEDYSYGEVYEFLDRRVQADRLVQLRDEFDLLYLILRFPADAAEEPAPGALVSVGPIQTVQHDREAVLEIIRRNELPGRLLPDLCEYYNAVPVVEDMDALECLLLYLVSGLFQRQYRLDRFPNAEAAFPLSRKTEQAVRESPQLARASVEQRYSAENTLLMAIAAGDYEKALGTYSQLSHYHIQARADDPLEDRRHLTVILNSLCRKTVEVAGVHPLYIDDLSTRFATEINRLNTPDELEALMSSMIREYCLLVRNHAMKGYSDITRQIVSYIDFHYTEELSLAYFARMFNLSKTYLSDLFRKETGTTLTDFIHQVRMRRAIVLLNASTLPITAVATACGYNDINYFIRRFKKTYGLSPKQYQKVIQHSSPQPEPDPAWPSGEASAANPG